MSDKKDLKQRLTQGWEQTGDRLQQLTQGWEHTGDRLQQFWKGWFPAQPQADPEDPPPGGDQHLALARESLRELLEDQRIPAQVREALAEDYAEVQQMLERLENGQLQIAAFGRVSVGKSALLNALLGEQRFSTSPLHGETKAAQRGHWQEYQAHGVFLVDTPGINEVDGEGREILAREVAARSDLVLFVVDGDITDTEHQALRELAAQDRPIVLVLNKLDRYSANDRAILFDSLRHHTGDVIDSRNILGAAAEPAERLVILVDEDGNEIEELRIPKPDIAALKAHLWDLLESEGKTLAALNASLFAGQLSDKVSARVLEAKRQLGETLIRKYSAAKGVAVAFNPIPVADLVTAAAMDISLVMHLSRLYGLPLSRSEAGELVTSIGGQMLLLMGTTWAVNLISSALKLGTTGLSTVVTGGAQAAVAYYSTYVVGEAAERYLAQGKSWGEGGPKFVVRQILDSLDRQSVIDQAKGDIRVRLEGRSE